MTIGLWEELLSPPIFITFIIGLIFFIWKYNGKYKNIILLWFIVPWSIIMFMPHYKVSEYGAGFIPAIILITTIFISYIKKTYAKTITLVLLTIFCLFQYMEFSYTNYHTLLDIKFKYENNFISYYNKFYSIMFYDVKKSNFNLIFIKYLKDNYPDNSFYIEENFSDDPASLVVQMYLNNINFISGENILSSDIIVIMDELKTVNEVVELKINKILENPLNAKMITEEFKNTLLLKTEYVFSEIRKNYDVIDAFYLSQKENKVTKVTLLGRKDKFPQFSE